ncbi:hypothetical protein [Mangrovimonas sp. YM274]|uniref:hypothetical protein n=1 Tax=Mangrovimonas sp. YM274 TaxID=3070660 RepID=UPI0027DD7E11|nr:hypothetical protein [Mangrovimonas sp. YM274]WMI68068.1 hypothetical protein RBH95_13050 [Mangrovimonas sp. YM274]
MKYVLMLIVLCVSIWGCNSSKSSIEVAHSLKETLWTYMDSEWSYQVRFKEGGVLETTHPNDNSKDNDTWEQIGDEVILEFNDGFSKYLGKMISPNVIEGTAKSKYASWKWRMERIQ